MSMLRDILKRLKCGDLVALASAQRCVAALNANNIVPMSTACSGTDGCVDWTTDIFRALGVASLDHVFACESIKDKRKFIAAQHTVKNIFPNIRTLHRGVALNTRTGTVLYGNGILGVCRACAYLCSARMRISASS
jgi:hypothetical protein